VGEFDGDNRTDIVAADNGQDAATTDTLAVLLHTTAAHTAPLTVETSPTGLSVDVYYGFPPGGMLSEYTTCGAAPCTYKATGETSSLTTDKNMRYQQNLKRPQDCVCGSWQSARAYVAPLR
jgi:hypothetical protein